MQNVFEVVQARSGAAIAGAFVYVYNSSSALATLYSDNGVTTTANPVTTNSDGEYEFYAANGTYSLVITAAGYDGQTINGKVLFDPSDTATAATTLQGTGLDTNAVGFRTIPQNSQSANYTTVASDSGKHILHPASDANARTFTIASNASVAYPIGAAITFVNQTSQVLTIAINTDTMTLANSTTTGSRSLAQNGVATALKVTATSWIISGTGLT